MEVDLDTGEIILEECPFVDQGNRRMVCMFNSEQPIECKLPTNEMRLQCYRKRRERIKKRKNLV